MAHKPVYFILAPPYTQDVGGIIFLHRLVHELRQIGEEAVLVPFPTKLRWHFRRWTNWIRRRPFFVVSQEFDTPVTWRWRVPSWGIAVYSEVFHGNPLNAKNVVRWLLYHPGKLGGPKTFVSDEMFFTDGNMMDVPELTGGAPVLHLWWVNPTYSDRGNPSRSGSCYMKRKGNEADFVHGPEARCLDKLSHAEIAEAFNTCERFYSYDDATMYSLFAAICGCDSIVISSRYRDRDDWLRGWPIARYGVAFGIEDLEHARTTRHLVRPHLAEMEAESLESVRNFVRLTRARFGFTPPAWDNVERKTAEAKGDGGRAND